MLKSCLRVVGVSTWANWIPDPLFAGVLRAQVARAVNYGIFLWHHIEPLMATLFDEPSTPSLDWAITLVSPYLDWSSHHFNQNTVTRWSSAVLTTLAVPHMEEAHRGVVITLLRIASVDTLRRYIPVSIWSWSYKQTSSPPPWLIHGVRTRKVLRQVRALGDIEILKSYLLLVWFISWGSFKDSAVPEVCTSIREDFNGIGMGHHRKELIERLSNVLWELEWDEDIWCSAAVTSFGIWTPKKQYRRLERVLLEVDREATNILTRTPSGFAILLDLLTLVDTYRISLDFYVQPPSPMSVTSCLQHSPPPPHPSVTPSSPNPSDPLGSLPSSPDHRYIC